MGIQDALDQHGGEPRWRAVENEPNSCRHPACGQDHGTVYWPSMARIPLEDNFNDVINKAQRGWKFSDADLAQRAEVSLEDLAAVKAGKPLDAVIRRVARHLK